MEKHQDPSSLLALIKASALIVKSETGTEYVTSEQDGVYAEEPGDRQTWLQLICCALSQLLCPVFQNHMRYYYEDPEESLEENSVTKGPDWRQKTERNLSQYIRCRLWSVHMVIY
jgi:hypothetical protein